MTNRTICKTIRREIRRDRYCDSYTDGNQISSESARKCLTVEGESGEAPNPLAGTRYFLSYFFPDCEPSRTNNKEQSTKTKWQKTDPKIINDRKQTLIVHVEIAASKVTLEAAPATQTPEAHLYTYTGYG